MLRVAILGCGKIADSHAGQIERIPDCEIVAVCDREELMVQQLAERFGIAQQFTDVKAMISEARPDVVHITTPPESHFELARLCLEGGCHVYVEKPFTLDTAEAEALVALAERKDLRLTAGHDAQFSPAARRLRAQVAKGYLGGEAVHMESYYGYDLSDGYAQALLGDAEHWARRLPGKLLQNIISHGVARIAEFLPGEKVEVIADGFVSPALRERGEEEIMDEVRVIIRDDRGTTAYFTFSSQMAPKLHQFRLFGPKNGLQLDEDEQILIRLRGGTFKSYLQKFLPPVIHAGGYLRNSLQNLGLFLRNDFHMKSGLKHLTEEFYGSIRGEGPVPIPYREILLTSRIMDEIFRQVHGSRQADPKPAEVPPGTAPPVGDTAKVQVRPSKL